MKSFSLLFLATVTLSSIKAAQFVNDIRQCTPLSLRPPSTSVHDLRPDDIKVIGALGDSVPAGFSVLNIKEFPAIVREYRSLSYTIGGEKDAFTIPNYIKYYRPNLTDYSTGVHAPEICSDYSTEVCTSGYNLDLDNFNAARSGAAPRMRSLKSIDFENDWKMINIEIGSNDLYQFCVLDSTEQSTPKKFGENIEIALEEIQANISKVLVNIVDVFNSSQVFITTKGKLYCHGKGSIDSRDFECPCSKN